MKDQIVLGVSFTPAEWSAGRAFFERIGRPDLSGRPLQQFGYTLDVASAEELRRMLDAWAAVGLDPSLPFVTWTRRYSHAELLRAPLLTLVVTRLEKGDGGPSHGTRYDLSDACPRCGTGARQVSPLVVRADEVEASGDVTRTLHGEVLLSPAFAAALGKAGVTGAELRPVEPAEPGGPQIPWVQLLAETELPPFAPETRGILREGPCPQCGRDGYFHSARHPQELVYRRSELPAGLPDVVCTWERFGNSRLAQPFSESSFARPLFLVTPRFYQVARAEKVRGLEFVPVEFRD